MNFLFHIKSVFLVNKKKKSQLNVKLFYMNIQHYFSYILLEIMERIPV